ncbi:MAG TPA: class I SAM-dependent methyltransferase [Thermoplasmata archaeon]|nr:class I SAM-dependent methyltransferase [Thermoplasmata archaeon]
MTGYQPLPATGRAARSRSVPNPGHRATSGAVRRRQVRERFDASVRREWARYEGEPWRALVRELRERFVRRHLPRDRGWVLELGPGPGRFTATLLGDSARLVAVDLSLPMLRALSRRQAVRSKAARLRRVRGAGELLPFRAGAFRASVALGNILGFSAGDGERLLSELARVTHPGGLLILDVASPVGATTDFLSMAAHRRLLSKVLRDPEFYFLNRVLGPSDRTRQPYAPERWGYFEFDFYTAAGAERALAAAGFRVIDRMALAPISAYRGRLTTIARRERRTWRNLLAVEERAGRRPGTLETGHGFVVAAVRATPRGRRRSRA